MFWGINTTLYRTSDIRLLREYGIFLLVGLFASNNIYKKLGTLVKNTDKNGVITRCFITVFYLSVFLVSLSFIVLGVNNPFLYQDF